MIITHTFTMARWQIVVLAVAFFLSFFETAGQKMTELTGRVFVTFKYQLLTNRARLYIFLNNNTHQLCVLCSCERMYVYESSQYHTSFHVHVYFT